MKTFSLNNIKSFSCSDEIEIKPITVFVGKNSCGKSSLLRFPVMLAQTFLDDALTPLLLFGNLIDYGNYDDVSYRHESRPIGFRITFGQELAGAIRRRNPLHRFSIDMDDGAVTAINNMELEVSIDKSEKKLQVRNLKLCFEGKKLCTIHRTDNKYLLTLHQIFVRPAWKDDSIEFSLPKMAFYKFIPLIDEDELIEQYAKEKHLFKENDEPVFAPNFLFNASEYIDTNIREDAQQEVHMLYQTFTIIKAYFRSIQEHLQNEAKRIAYIGPFRENPKRTYRDSESSFNDVGVNGENTSMILRQATQGNRELLENVSEWLTKTMGYSLDIKDIGNDLYSLMVCGNQETDNIIDVGYGISQVLPIVTQLYNNNDYRQNPYGTRISKRKTAIFEQPEIHLHPAAQAQLADLFVDCITDKKGMLHRLLIETHSEHLIRKLQVLVADPDIKISNDQIAIYYVDKDENGDSHVEKMNMCDNGQFEKAWPTGFFDKSYELTKMLMKANSKILNQEQQDD